MDLRAQSLQKASQSIPKSPRASKSFPEIPKPLHSSQTTTKAKTQKNVVLSQIHLVKPMILRKSSQKRWTVTKNSKNPNLRYSCDCAGPPLVRVRGIWVFGVFWDSTTFLATLSQKCGTALTKPLILLKLSHILVKK